MNKIARIRHDLETARSRLEKSPGHRNRGAVEGLKDLLLREEAIAMKKALESKNAR